MGPMGMDTRGRVEFRVQTPEFGVIGNDIQNVLQSGDVEIGMCMTEILAPMLADRLKVAAGRDTKTVLLGFGHILCRLGQ